MESTKMNLHIFYGVYSVVTAFIVIFIMCLVTGIKQFSLTEVIANTWWFFLIWIGMFQLFAFLNYSISRGDLE